MEVVAVLLEEVVALLAGGVVVLLLVELVALLAGALASNESALILATAARADLVTAL